ncbi:MAG: hypothetical protein A2629_00320 [Candidatus Levybacteria bacterium RIFCSPHIGHO2_01_FULL_41_15]|nr:MAG: hypothetical protein A2629_00320 [Candidatus Levybacteria bacterium RIFCSPHIGHO2_01_FULL_41_15]
MNKKATAQLVDEINSALKDLMWGSVEIYVQDNVVTQITVKNIKKTRVSTRDESKRLENSKNEKQVLTNRKHTNILTNID